ncbi:MAG: hypothetical protein K2Q25_07105, partial [Mycobacteriaceae bacterium]|nr:hypothetical protein [Mycobacteriaceae bacterium]
LAPFAPPPVTTKMAALADQASAVAAAVAAELQERMSTVEQALHAYLAATDFPAAHGAAAVLQGVWGQISGMLSKAQDTMSGAAQTTLSGLAGGTGLAQSLAGGLGKFAAGSTGAAGPSAQLGRAVSVGRLSVPPSWSSTMGLTTSTESAVGVLPDFRAGVSALPDSGIAAEPAAMWGGSPAAQGRITSQPARRVTVIPRMPCAG